MKIRLNLMRQTDIGSVTHTVTEHQIVALRAAVNRGGAIHLRGSRAGGAKRRMCERLAEQGLVEDCPPFPITDRGLLVLAEIDRLRAAKVESQP